MHSCRPKWQGVIYSTAFMRKQRWLTNCSSPASTSAHRFVPISLRLMNELLGGQQASHPTLAAGGRAVAEVKTTGAAPLIGPHCDGLVQVLPHTYGQAGPAPGDVRHCSGAASNLFAICNRHETWLASHGSQLFPLELRVSMDSAGMKVGSKLMQRWDITRNHALAPALAHRRTLCGGIQSSACIDHRTI